MNRFWKIRNEANEDTAEIMIYGEISDETWLGDEVTPKQFAEDLKQCDGKTLNVRVNSPGGDVFAAQAIYNQLKSYAGSVIMHIDGMCASAATILTCAGDKVIMPDNAAFMIHNPKVALAGYYDTVDLGKMTDQLDTVKQTIVNVYTKRCKDSLPENKIKKMMDAETWMSAQEAKDNGFIDEIDDSFVVKNDISGEKITINSVSFSLNRFKNSRKLQEILGKTQEKTTEKGVKAMENKDILSAIKSLLGINAEEPADGAGGRAAEPQKPIDAVDNPLQMERKRMLDLDAMDDKDNPAVTSIINLAKQNGNSPEEVKAFIDAVKGTSGSNDGKPNNGGLIDEIKNLIIDQMNSGAGDVKTTPAEAKGAKTTAMVKKQQADEVVNMINGMRGGR